MRRVRKIAALAGVVVALSAAILWLFTRREASTRIVCIDGHVCTEHFNLKDGMPIDTVCPSQGGESYPLPEGCTRSNS